jgi:hypothetical protein
MKSLLAAAAVAAFVAAALPSPARADCFGCGVATGVVAGTIIGAAIAAPPPPPPPVVYEASPPPPYAEPPPDYYADGPVCHTEQDQVWDGRAWRTRNYQVCD